MNTVLKIWAFFYECFRRRPCSLCNPELLYFRALFIQACLNLRNAEMKLFCILFLTIASLWYCTSGYLLHKFTHIRSKTSDEDQEQAVKDLIARLLPERAHEFDVVVNNSLSVDHKDVFAFKTVGGKLVFWRNTGVSAAWAFHHYLKYYCKAHISWSGNQLDSIPEELPVVKEMVQVTVPHR